MTPKDIIEGLRLNKKLDQLDHELASALVKYLQRDGPGAAEIMQRIADLSTALRFLEYSVATDAISTYLDERLRHYLGLVRVQAEKEETAN